MQKLLIAASAAIALTAMTAQAEVITLATIAPGTSANLTMTTFANIVSDHLDDVEIEVSATGAATVHMMEVGRGNLDMSMTSPVVYNLMKAGKAMYANQEDAPALSENLRLLMWFPYGQYHYAVRADNDAMYLDDIAGQSVFFGPQGGGAYNAATGFFEAATDLTVDDVDAVKASWSSGFQGFLDGDIDVYVNGCLDPCPQFSQVVETDDIRFLGPKDPAAHQENITQFLGKFRFAAEIPAGVYEGQVNETAVATFDTAVGIAARADMSDDRVYAIIKTFWENLDSIASQAPWAKALDVKYAAAERGAMQLHPGAARYYDEIGVR